LADGKSLLDAGRGIEQQTAAHAFSVAQGEPEELITGAHTDRAESLRVSAHRGCATERHLAA